MNTEFLEALESGMCDVIKIRLKGRDATRSGKGNQQLNIKTAVERPILKLGLPNFRWSFYISLLLVASLLFRHFFGDVTHATFQCFQNRAVICYYSVTRWFDSLLKSCHS